MEVICDLYFENPTIAPGLKFSRIFDKEFKYVSGAEYSGYVVLNIERIKMVSVVMDLRKMGVEACSAPIKYRDSPNLSSGEAHAYALRYAFADGVSVEDTVLQSSRSSPLVWMFRIVNDPQQRIGGVVRIDKIDGRRWTSDEYVEYLYDYNNII